MLQPSKCFYSIILFEWTHGEWKYATINLRGEYGMTVPLPSSSKAAISHKSIGHAKKTLGAMTSLDGNSSASICMMQDKAQQWINDVCHGHLHRQNVWFSLKVQFWPCIGYNLCSSTASFQELDRALHRQYYQILPLADSLHYSHGELDNRRRFLWFRSPAPWCSVDSPSGRATAKT